MEKFINALEVLEELRKEVEDGLQSEHFSIRYSSERSLKSIEEVKEHLQYKIEEMEEL